MRIVYIDFLSDIVKAASSPKLLEELSNDE